MSFRPSDSSPSAGGRCCDMMGRRPSHGHHLWPEHNRHWRTSSSILFLVSSLLILAIANAHQQLPTAAGTSIFCLFVFFSSNFDGSYVSYVYKVVGVLYWGRTPVNAESFQVEPTASKLWFLEQRRRRSSSKLINAKSFSCSPVCL